MPVESSIFELLSSFDVEYSPTKITKYRSRRTGLQLALVAQSSPIVNGYFAVATEVPDDSGTPHTLEHLIFMGSQKYPYKGLLDTLGNVAYSNTNAWTATDQTVYTLTTAGWEGFKLLLPVYLDHVLNPSLTDEACYTEVYHVDGEGKEKGVVFSEMSGIQDASWFITGLNAQRALYDERSGYSSETGGLVENLRFLGNDKIREFHQDSYRPSNLCVVVNGLVDEAEFIRIMEKFDAELPDQTTNFRPFLDSPYQIKHLPQKITKEVTFPEKDESCGEISITWVGPSHDKWDEDLAVTLLLEYLCESSISLLTKHLIEIDEPLASDIEYNTDDFTHTMPHITLNNVPTEKLRYAESQVFELLRKHACVDQFDLVKMREVIENSKVKLIFAVEKSAEILTDYVITDFLYGDTEGRSLNNLRTLADYEAISAWTAEQWVELFQRYLIKNHPAVIISKPSKELYKANKAAAKKLLNDRLEELGEDGLKQLKDKLHHAMEQNDKPIPQEILDKFPRPSPSNIQLIDTLTVGLGLNKSVENDLSNPLVQTLNNDTPQDLQLYLNVDQFPSEFLTIDLLLSSHVVPEQALPYFELFQEIFNLSVEFEGQYYGYETIVKEVANDTVLTGLYAGFDNQFTETITVKIQARKSNYIKAIDWFVKILYHTVWEESRTKTLIEKILNSLPSLKRDGSSMLTSLQTRHCFTDRSLHKARDFIHSEQFYRNLLKRIENGEFEQIKLELEHFRTALFQPSNIKVVIAGDLASIQSPVSSWSTHFLSKIPSSNSSELSPIPRAKSVLTPLGSQLTTTAKIIATPTATATYLISSTVSPTEYRNIDSVYLAVASSYLQAVEGPFWRGIRGTGLAYGANLARNVEFGRLSFDVYRGADAVQAYKVARTIIADLVEGKVEVDETLFVGAISSLISGIANSESNYYAAAAAKFTDVVLKERGADYNQWFMKQLENVSKEGMVNCLRQNFGKLFDGKESAVFACCNPAKVNELREFFEKEGYTVDVEELEGSADDEEDCEFDDEEDDFDDEDEEFDSEEEETDSEEESSDDE